MTEIINLTPHPVLLQGTGRTQKQLEPASIAVRVKFKDGPQIDQIDGLPIHAPSEFVRITGLPPERPDTLLIVSQIAAHFIAAVMPSRRDITYPVTARQKLSNRSTSDVLHVTKLVTVALPETAP